jgi:hypothetical protein
VSRRRRLVAPFVALVLVVGGCSGARDSPSADEDPGGSGSPGGPVDVLVSYSRSGGPSPGEAEQLTIATTGDYELRRTVGGTRVGSFAGTLDPADLATLRRMVDAVEGSVGSSAAVAPESVTERVTAGDRTAEVSDPAGVPAPWQDLLERLRSDVDTLVTSPVGGLELVVQASPPRASVGHIGTVPVELVGGSLAADVTVVDAAGLARDTWTTTVALDESDVPPGWTRDLGLEAAGFELAAGEGLDVTVELGLRGPDGVVRTALMSATAP